MYVVQKHKNVCSTETPLISPQNVDLRRAMFNFTLYISGLFSSLIAAFVFAYLNNPEILDYYSH